MSLGLPRCMFPWREMTQEEREDIPHPRAELQFHVATKTSQLGAGLGLVVVGPLVGGLRGKSFQGALQGGLRGGRIGLVVGFLTGPLLVELAMRGKEEEQIYDRALRIRYNQGQMRTDRFFFSGALGGLALGGLALGGLLGPGLLGGAVLGGLGGCLGAGLTNKRQ